MLKYLEIFDKKFIRDNNYNLLSYKGDLIFGKAPTTYNKAEKYMIYNPQFTYGKPYIMKRDGSDVTNLDGFNGRTDTENLDGKRYPRSIQKFNLERGLHPTQKPVSLSEMIIKTYTNENDTVVDICCGSGTNAIASIKTNRKFIVNDSDLKYYDCTINRIENAQNSISQTI